MAAAPLAHARALAADPRLIIPLDVATVDEARALVERLGDAASFYKIGLQLFATGGMALAAELKAQGKQVFLDWKLHDIGATVQRAAAVLAESGCDFLTVHGEPQVHRIGARTVQVFPIFHPAAGLRTPSVKELLRADFTKLPALLAAGPPPQEGAMPAVADAGAAAPPEEPPADQLGLFG